MSSIFLLVLFSAIFLPEIAGSADTDEPGNGDPMVMVKSTLKTWHSMYSYYRDEITLGYCWADYFVDVKKLVNALAGPRMLGTDPKDPTPLVAILKGWFDDGETRKEPIAENLEGEKYEADNETGDNSIEDDYYDQNYDRGTDNASYQSESPDNNNAADQFTVHHRNPYNEGFDNGEKLPRYIYPGIYAAGKRSDEVARRFSGPENLAPISTPSVLKTVRKSDDARKSKARGLSDVFISVLGFKTPPGLGPLMLSGGQGPNPIFHIVLRVIGTVMRIGRKALDTIQGVSILACSKDYLVGKILHWIDS